MKILIVEDDLMVSFLNQEFCKKYDSQVELTSVTDAEQAKEALKTQKFDLVLLDMFMPKGNGLEILTMYHKRAEFILITADSSQATLSKALEHGAVDYLLKPYAYERFVTAMDRFKRIYSLKKQETPMAQENIDSFFGVSQTLNKHSHEMTDLPKGLNAQTMIKIIGILLSLATYYSTTEIAERVGLSRISTKKYIDYLVEEDLLDEQVIYLKQGRPVSKYQVLPTTKERLKQLMPKR